MSSALPPVFQTLPTTKSSYNLPAVLDAALIAYKKQTRQNLIAHPLATQLQACDSPKAMLVILQSYSKQFGSSPSGDERLNAWFGPAANVLDIFYAKLDEGVGSVNINSFVGHLTLMSVQQRVSPAKVVVTGVGVFFLVSDSVFLAWKIL
jgi:hypothetical protein